MKDEYISIKANESGLPARFFDKTRDTFPPCLALKQITAFCKDLPYNISNGNGVYLYGPRSTGKTFLACQIGLQALHLLPEVSVSYLNYTEICDWALTSSGKPSRTTFERGILHPDVLIVDYVGKPYTDKAGFVQVMDRLITRRFDFKKVLVLISILDPDEFREAFGAGASTKLKQTMFEVQTNQRIAEQKRKLEC